MVAISSSVGPYVAQIDPALAAGMERSSVLFRRGRRRRTTLVRVLQGASVIAFLVLWEILAAAGVLNQLFFSRPSAIAAFIADHFGYLVHNTAVTLRATLLGFVIGSVAGILTALVMARFRTLDRVLQPWISVLMSLPRIALAPLFLLWFGITETSKVALAVSLVYFMVLVSTLAGTKILDSDLTSMAEVYGANGMQLFAKIIIPGAVPGIFAGLRLGVVTSVLGVIASEMVASSDGLGQIIVLYGQNLQSAGVFAVLVFLAVITSLLNGLLALWEGHLMRWQS
jgi:NitT/TauT family transport system permease protein